MIIDADGAILGRLSSKVVKRLLAGEQVVIVNADKAIVSGTPKVTYSIYLQKRQRGDQTKGPFYPKQSDRIVWRTIRGMMPYKKSKGRDAMSRLKIFSDCPKEYNNAEKIVKTKESLKCKYVTLKEISKFLGAKVD
ncbi:MAG: 50S ribosomal protein L13 [Candidatus Aenigmarchaeota archaeon]|nr:50S ribosomal protein L13 [Candidatus Aenigmarchaeota archaeon]